MNYSIKRTVLAIALFGALGAANATTLWVETPVYGVDMVAGSFGGTLLDSAVTNISSPAYSGTARTAVYDTGSGLDFYYQFSNDANSQTGINRLSAFDFSALDHSTAVDVYQTSDAFGIFQTGNESSSGADRGLAGVIGFNFVPGDDSKIDPGMTSFTQIIRTNARYYMPGNLSIINGHATNAMAFAPAVPEPEAFAMLLAGLGLMGTIARRRTRNNRT